MLICRKLRCPPEHSSRERERELRGGGCATPPEVPSPSFEDVYLVLPCPPRTSDPPPPLAAPARAQPGLLDERGCGTHVAAGSLGLKVFGPAVGEEVGQIRCRSPLSRRRCPVPFAAASPLRASARGCGADPELLSAPLGAASARAGCMRAVSTGAWSAVANGVTAGKGAHTVPPHPPAIRLQRHLFPCDVRRAGGGVVSRRLCPRHWRARGGARERWARAPCAGAAGGPGALPPACARARNRPRGCGPLGGGP